MPMTRVTLAVNRTAHCALLGDLDQAPREMWYVCHGYGQLAHRFLKRFETIEVPGRLIVAPEGLSRYYVRGSGGRVGASWMTREDRDQEILDYLNYLDSLHQHLIEGWDKAPERLVLLGFSQGCATVTRWATRARTANCFSNFFGKWFPYSLIGGQRQRNVAGNMRGMTVRESHRVVRRC